MAPARWHLDAPENVRLIYTPCYAARVGRTTPDVFKDLPDFSRLTILVIDDHQDGRDFLSEALRACGATAFEADNIPTAKTYVSTRKLNLVATSRCRVRTGPRS